MRSIAAGLGLASLAHKEKDIAHPTSPESRYSLRSTEEEGAS
jgi:hypothetical protein